MEENKHKNVFRPGIAILTNIEEYDLKVRTDADNYAKKIEEEIDLLKQQAQDTLKESESIKAGIEKESQEARESAYKDGYQNGFNDGQNKAHEETISMLNSMHNLLIEIEGLKAKKIQHSEQDIVKLSLILARFVLLDELKTQPDISLNRIKNLVQKIESVGKVKIKINPQEYEYIKEYKHEIEKYIDDDQVIVIKIDESVNVGSPIIETDSFEIDSAFEKQFKILEEEFAHIYYKRANINNKNIENQKLENRK